MSMTSEPHPGSVRFRYGHSRHWRIVEPNEQGYSMALMFAQEVWGQNGWEEISGEIADKLVRKEIRMRNKKQERETGEEVEEVDFKVGDLVRLKGDSPVLTVTRICEGALPEVDVAWFLESEEFRTARFPNAALERDDSQQSIRDVMRRGPRNGQ